MRAIGELRETKEKHYINVYRSEALRYSITMGPPFHSLTDERSPPCSLNQHLSLSRGASFLLYPELRSTELEDGPRPSASIPVARTQNNPPLECLDVVNCPLRAIEEPPLPPREIDQRMIDLSMLLYSRLVRPYQHPLYFQ